MPVESATLIKFVIAMLSIMDPPGAVPMFMAVTAGRSNAEKHRIALVTSLAVFVTLILAALAGPLAQAGVSIFAISTYDTDYLLVKEASLQQALAALQSAGHRLSS